MDHSLGAIQVSIFLGYNSIQSKFVSVNVWTLFLFNKKNNYRKNSNVLFIGTALVPYLYRTSKLLLRAHGGWKLFCICFLEVILQEQISDMAVVRVVFVLGKEPAKQS